MKSTLSPSKKKEIIQDVLQWLAHFNTSHCKGLAKYLFGFTPTQKLLFFLFGRMHSSIFPCQVVLTWNYAFARDDRSCFAAWGCGIALLCLWRVFTLRVT